MLTISAIAPVLRLSFIRSQIISVFSVIFVFNVAAFSLNHRLDTDPETGAYRFHKRRRELGEYSVDGGDQAGFGVVGGHVGDGLDV